MKNILTIGLCVILFQGGIAQQANPTAEFDKVMETQFRPDQPGAVALVSKNGKIVYEKAIGMADMELVVPLQNNSIFKIGSVTKQFTAVAILQLAEKGKLNINDGIVKYIPDYPVHGYKITIEHLLTHTSGIKDFTSIDCNDKRSNTDYTPKDMIGYFKDQPMRFAPGTKWEYSNSGYFLLGYIIEKITGKTYAQYLEENIFRLVGMANTSYSNDTNIIKNRAKGYTRDRTKFKNAGIISMSQPYAAGAIQSPVEDLMKWN